MNVRAVSFGNRIIKTGNDLRKSFSEVSSKKISDKEFMQDIMQIKMPKKEIEDTITKLEQENPKNKVFTDMVRGLIARLSD